MAKRSGFSEKRMLNRRFRGTEEAILDALFSAKNFLNMESVVGGAKISRSTFYRHHKTIHSVVSDYERYVLKKYIKILSKIMHKRDVEIKILYRQMLVFMMVNKKVLLFLLKNNNGEVVRKMIRKLEPSVVEECRWPKESKKMFEIYVNEIFGVVEGWSKENFAEGRIEVVLGDIMYLTETSRKRLLPLEN